MDWTCLAEATGAQPATRRVLAALRRSESPVPHGAKVARTVLRAAEQGNRCAREILTEAHREVALVTLGLIRRLHFRETIPLSYGGALLDEEDFRAGWWKTLRSLAGSSSRRLALVPPGTDAATAAALWGLKS